MDNYNSLMSFDHQQFGHVRTITHSGNIWFVAADVCKALDIANTSQAVNRLDADERSMFNIGRQGNTNCINEYGLYGLVLASRKSQAREFKRWITHEVIPAIREHGGYLTPKVVESVLSDPDTIIHLATELKVERESSLRLAKQNSELQVKNAIMQPKADYFDGLVDRNLLTSLRETAKELDIKERKFIGLLLARGYLYRDQKGKLMPYAEYANSLFEIKEAVNQKSGWSGVQTLVTPRGRETFRLLLKGGAA